MIKRFMHILIMVAAAAMLVWSCSKDDQTKIISRSELAKIYAEMLVTDQ